MKTFAHWIISGMSAGIIIHSLNTFLPDMERGAILAIGGMAALLWHHFIDEPLYNWAKS